MRKTYVLYSDGSVVKTKMSIQKMRTNGILKAAKAILIPIQSTSSTYVAVDPIFLDTTEFTRADVSYHMKSFSGERSIESKDEWMSALDPVKDYYTITLCASTWEEFYQLLQNIFVFNFLQTSLEQTMDDYMNVTYIDIRDISIKIFNKKAMSLEYTFLYDVDAEQHPSGMSGNEIITPEILKRFGYIQTNSAETAPHILMRKQGERLVYEYETRTFALTSNFHRIGVPCEIASTYSLMSLGEFNQFLRIQSGVTAIAVIDNYPANGQVAPEQSDYDFIRVTGYYEVPRFGFDRDLGESVPGLDMVSQVYTMEHFSKEDILTIIEYIGPLQKIIVECEKGICHNEYGKEKMDNFIDVAVTLFTEVQMDIDGETPNDTTLTIATDPYQVHQPTIKETLYVLALQETEA